MTWYLTIRALCIVAFVAAFGSLFGSACLADDGRRSAARRWVVLGFGFTFLGCVLVGFGWGEGQP